MEVLIGPAARDDRDFTFVDRDASWRAARFGGLRRETGDSTDARNLGLGFGFASRGSGRSEDDKSVSDSVSPLSSSSSSSIGEQSDDDGEEVQSQARSGLSSLEPLEDSLPVKKGLSNHFAGKSRSFTNLSAVGSVEDLKKVENPINKRRRTLMASKWARKAGRASFYGWSSHPTSMPSLALPEDDDDDGEEHGVGSPSPRDQGHGNEPRRMMSFKSPSCFCLTDLQEEDEEDDDQ